jgi:hypothetical protein
MPLSVRILAVVSMLLSAIAVGLAVWKAQAQLPGMDLRGYLFLLAGAIAFLVGLATFVVALVATTQHQQLAWLLGLIGTGRQGCDIGVYPSRDQGTASRAPRAAHQMREDAGRSQTDLPAYP